MTTSPTFLTDALATIVGPDHLAWVASWQRAPYDPTSDLDESTLRLMRRRVTTTGTSYRRAMDHPREVFPDELGVATGDYRDDWSA